ncbi:MAG: hypothetical protein ACK4N5_12065, partial [Myxococcales bacterium]
GTSLEGTLEGGRFSVRSQAAREFSCGNPAVRCAGVLRERVEGRLIGLDEAGRISGCEDDPVPGAAPVDPGEAVMVCGFLTDQLAPLDNNGCGCQGCLIVYELAGRRQ